MSTVRKVRISFDIICETEDDGAIRWQERYALHLPNTVKEILDENTPEEFSFENFSVENLD